MSGCGCLLPRGWNPVFPSHFCVAEIQGEDVDVATWEFGECKQLGRCAVSLGRRSAD